MYRSNDAWLGGVCASIARRFDLDPIAVRILTVMFACVTFGVGAIVYVALWAFLPPESKSGALCDVQPEEAESSAFGFLDLAGHQDEIVQKSGSDLPIAARLAIAVCLLLLFLVVSLGVSPIVDGSHWWQFWPIACVICGVYLIVMPVHSKHEAVWHSAGIAVTSLAAATLPITLGIMSWDTFGVAVSRMWPLAILSIAMFFVGAVRSSNALMISGALCFTAFLVLMLMFCGVPGNVGELMLNFPGGHSMQIGLAPLFSQ